MGNQLWRELALDTFFAARLGIRGTPTVLYFQAGKELERVAGFRSSLFHREAVRELFDLED